MDDFCLRSHPTYKDLFKDKPVAARPAVEWLPAHEGIMNSRCGKYQCRKQGNPPIYSLWNARLGDLRVRLIRDGFKSFSEAVDFLRRGDA
jgi:hypothetical protein